MTDLKNFRAPRPWMRWFLAGALAVAAVSVMGPMDFASQLELEAENKLLRVELALLKRPRAEVAPMWKRCPDPKRQEWHAVQPDGGRWRAWCRDGFLKIQEETM